MPVALLPKFLDLPIENDTEITGLAFVMDLRERDFLPKHSSIFKSIKKSIELLEANEPDNENIDELKLILSDNLLKNGKIHSRYSLMNKNFYLFYLNYKDCMHK